MSTVSTARVLAALRRAGQLLDLTGTIPEEFTSVTDDSRAVHPGALFVAVRGVTRDGHEFLPQAAA